MDFNHKLSITFFVTRVFGHKYEQNMEKFVLFYDVQAFEDREINNARND